MCNILLNMSGSALLASQAPTKFTTSIRPRSFSILVFLFFATVAVIWAHHLLAKRPRFHQAGHRCASDPFKRCTAWLEDHEGGTTDRARQVTRRSNRHTVQLANVVCRHMRHLQYDFFCDQRRLRRCCRRARVLHLRHSLPPSQPAPSDLARLPKVRHDLLQAQCGRVAGIHGDVLNLHTESVFESTHGVFSVPDHTAHTTPHHTTPHHTRRHTHHQHTEKEDRERRQREKREDEREKRKRKRKEEKETREEKRRRRQEKRRDKTREERGEEKRREKRR